MLSWIEIRDFRPYHHVRLELSEGLTVLTGPNGSGKSSVLEACGCLAGMQSFRGASLADLVRVGAPVAVLRGEFWAQERYVLVETEIAQRRRILLDKSPLTRSGDLEKLVSVVVFQPDDLEIPKGSPSVRRAACDEAVVGLFPFASELLSSLNNCLKQRNALLRRFSSQQQRSTLDESIAHSLDIWDERFADIGTRWAELRKGALAEIQPYMAGKFTQLNPPGAREIVLSYEPEWLETGLLQSLQNMRQTDLARASTSVGPHRDDIFWRIDGMAVRTHASQGQQRALVLAFRLALHSALAERFGKMPVLMLDDVFSEMDMTRQELLLDLLPNCQVLLTTAGVLPRSRIPDAVIPVLELEQ